MAKAQKCPTCGSELPGDSPGGHCPHCLLQLALTTGEDTADTRSTIKIELPPESPLAEKPGDRIGRYKLLQQLGEGGCGVVYMADQSEPVRRRVALKVIKPGMDSKQVLARFEAERQALALMDHPNIAKVLDAGATETGRPYFVMELVKGIPITRYCDEKQLSTESRLNLFVLVCQAVQHAHQKGIIHRDIKPSNILVADHDGTPVPKIIDFGIAKATTDQRLTDKTLFTAFEQFIGTPAYMSPEQATLSGLDIDTRSDIYSLGVLLYELLTGKTPFDAKELLAKGLDEIRRVIREVEPQRPSTRLSTLDAVEKTTVAHQRQSEPPKLQGIIRGDLDWIVMKALEKDRTRRYETANGLAMDIQRHLSNEPVVARPPSNLYRFQKLVRRNKLAFAAATSVATALILGFAVSVWALYGKNRAYHLALGAEQKATSEANKSKQVAQFLQDMLESVGPSISLGRDTTLLREILDRTAERIDKGLTNQPVEAELLTTIGQVYFELQQNAEAVAMFRRALAIHREQRQEQETADVLNWLASALWLNGRLAEAEITAREALRMQRDLPGVDSAKVCGALNTLAVVLHEQGKLTEAESTSRQAIAGQKKATPAEDENTANYVHTLAAVLKDEGKLAEAETAFREALAISRRIFSKGNPNLANLLDNMAALLIKQDKPAEAEALQQEAETMRRKLLGHETPAVADGLGYLAKQFLGNGRVAEAEALYREALAIKQKIFGKDAQPTCHTLSDLGELLLNERRFPEAEAVLGELVATLKRTPGAGKQWVGHAYYALGNAFKEQGKLTEAVGAFKISAEYGDGGGIPYLAWMYQSGQGVAQDFGEAVKLYRKGLEQNNSMSQNNLAWMYEQGEGVEKNLAEAAKLYRKSAASGHKLAKSNLARLFRLGLATPENRAESIEFYQALLDEAQAAASSGNAQALNAFAWLFATSPRVEIRDGLAAVALAKQAVAVTQRKDSAILDTLGAAYAEAGQFTNAVSAQKEALALVTDENMKQDLTTRLNRYQTNSPYRNTDEDYLSPNIEDPIQLAGFLRARGALRAQFGDWKETISDLTKATTLNPDDNLSWFFLAPLLLENGNLEGYFKHRQTMLARFGHTNDPLTAQRIAKASLLRPAEAAAMATIAELANTALGLSTNAQASGFQFTKGLADYRLGHYAEASDWMTKALAAEKIQARRVQDHAVLAMAQHQMGKLVQARDSLANANDIHETKSPKLDSGNFGGNFHDWFIARILTREAKALIEGTSRTNDLSQ